MPFETTDVATSGTTVTDNAIGSRGIDAMIVTTSSGTATSFPLYDAHGNMVATLARSGSTFITGNPRSFDAWGGMCGGPQSGAPRGRYCAQLGHVQDDESGLIYMRARFYEPGTGRFVSEDRGMYGGNYFVYRDDSPLDSLDYTGRDPYKDFSGYLSSVVPKAFLDAFSSSMGIVGMGLAVVSCGLLDQAKTVGEVTAAIGVAEGAVAVIALGFSCNNYSGAKGGIDAVACLAIEAGLAQVQGGLTAAAASTAIESKGLAGAAVCAAFAYDLVVTGAIISNAIDDAEEP